MGPGDADRHTHRRIADTPPAATGKKIRRAARRAMSSLRRFAAHDLLRFNEVNLDYFTETVCPPPPAARRPQAAAAGSTQL